MQHIIWGTSYYQDPRTVFVVVGNSVSYVAYRIYTIRLLVQYSIYQYLSSFNFLWYIEQGFSRFWWHVLCQNVNIFKTKIFWEILNSSLAKEGPCSPCPCIQDSLSHPPIDINKHVGQKCIQCKLKISSAVPQIV